MLLQEDWKDVDSRGRRSGEDLSTELIGPGIYYFRYKPKIPHVICRLEPELAEVISRPEAYSCSSRYWEYRRDTLRWYSAPKFPTLRTFKGSIYTEGRRGGKYTSVKTPFQTSGSQPFMVCGLLPKALNTCGPPCSSIGFAISISLQSYLVKVSALVTPGEPLRTPKGSRGPQLRNPELNNLLSTTPTQSTNTLSVNKRIQHYQQFKVTITTMGSPPGDFDALYSSLTIELLMT